MLVRRNDRESLGWQGSRRALRSLQNQTSTRRPHRRGGRFPRTTAPQFRTVPPRVVERRAERQKLFDDGRAAGFSSRDARHSRGRLEGGAIPADLQDRRVEITGPPDRKMVINALNSGAKVFMADFEDANSPTWDNLSAGPSQSQGPLGRQARFHRSRSGKSYALKSKPAVLMVRPRGWHLLEAHMMVDGKPMCGRAFRFRPLLLPQRQGAARRRASGPISICPRSRAITRRGCGTMCSSSHRAMLGLPLGTIKATVLIETLPAAFEMDEILYELRDHIVGLNCGRWDYIFSLHQDLRQQRALRPARSRASDDVEAVPAAYSGCSSKPVIAAAPSRWAAWRRRFRSATTPKRTTWRSKR